MTGVNWRTSILPVKFINAEGHGSNFRLAKALDWVVAAKKAGVDIRKALEGCAR